MALIMWLIMRWSCLLSYTDHVPLEALNKELSRHESNSQQAARVFSDTEGSREVCACLLDAQQWVVNCADGWDPQGPQSGAVVLGSCPRLTGRALTWGSLVWPAPHCLESSSSKVINHVCLPILTLSILHLTEKSSVNDFDNHVLKPLRDNFILKILHVHFRKFWK